MILLKPSKGVVIEVVRILIHLPRNTRVLVIFIDGLPLKRVAVDAVRVTA